MQRLLVRAANRICALRLTDVEETMRELGSTPFAGVPAWVRGASVIRGSAVPVVDLGALLGGDAVRAAGRMVTVRSRSGSIALVVDEVLGVRDIAESTSGQRSSLLDGADRKTTDELATLDGHLLAILEVGELLPDELHERIVSGAAA